MGAVIRFFVEGLPVAKGNHTAFPMVRGKCDVCRPGAPCRKRNCVGGLRIGATISDDKGPELEAWEQMIKVCSISARNGAAERIYTSDVAVMVRFTFLMPRPKGHYTTTGALSAAGQRMPFPVTRPDFDKLTRAAADGMTGAIWEDDSQVAFAPIAKLWGTGKTGVAIAAMRLVHVPADAADDLLALGLGDVRAQGALL